MLKYITGSKWTNNCATRIEYIKAKPVDSTVPYQQSWEPPYQIAREQEALILMDNKLSYSDTGQATWEKRDEV